MQYLGVDQVCFLIVKARQLDVPDTGEPDEPEGSNPTDDDFRDALLGEADDATEEEMRSLIAAMDSGQQAELIALAFVGRGDFSAEEWTDALHAAGERGPASVADYLLEMPLLADYLDEGLAAFGLSCVEGAEP